MSIAIPIDAPTLIARAARACRSARLLFEDEDIVGACNRAYYAMFDATRAALLIGAPEASLDVSKTHRGLINAFHQHLIKSEKLDTELGKSLNRVEDIRLICDYRGDPVESDVAIEVVEQAEVFTAAIQAAFFAPSPSDDG